MHPKINLIVAVGYAYEMGVGDSLLGNFPTDMKHFVSKTCGHVVIVGRKTFDGFRRKPLPNRVNIVVTRDTNFAFEQTLVAHSCEQALALARSKVIRQGCEIFVIGGQQIYQEFLEKDLVDRIYLTRYDLLFPEADRVFPTHTGWLDWRVVEKEELEADGITMHFQTFEK